MESSDMANKLVQQLLNDETLDKEFDLDKMKFSRNYEGSFFPEGLNAGAKVVSMIFPYNPWELLFPRPNKKDCYCSFHISF